MEFMNMLNGIYEYAKCHLCGGKLKIQHISDFITDPPEF